MAAVCALYGLYAGLGRACLLPRLDLQWFAGGARRHDARRDGQPPLLLVVAHGPRRGSRSGAQCSRLYPPHQRPAPRRQVGRLRPAHDDHDEARVRAVCGGVRVWMQSQMRHMALDWLVERHTASDWLAQTRKGTGSNPIA